MTTRVIDTDARDEERARRRSERYRRSPGEDREHGWDEESGRDRGDRRPGGWDDDEPIAHGRGAGCCGRCRWR